MGAASPARSVARVEHGSQGRHDERCVGRARWLPLLLERLGSLCGRVASGFLPRGAVPSPVDGSRAAMRWIPRASPS